MYITRISLLSQLIENNPQSWQQFNSLYKPMLSNWLKAYLLQTADVEDLSQEIMVFVAQHIHSFQHNGQIGAFRHWLRLVTVNITRNYLRKTNRVDNNLTSLLVQLEDPYSNLSLQFNLAHDRMLIQVLLNNLAKHFQDDTINIFTLHVIEGWSVQDTAAKMHVSVAAVYVAKSKILRRLRKDAKEWLNTQQLI
jgi:RNA polymerase sigma-70 factor (ECF subfamily)